jgi:flagellar basal body P-ring formation protein FlgA
MKSIFALCAFAAASPLLAAAPAFEDLAALDARISETQDEGLIAQPIDRRIKLAPCPSPAEIDAPVVGSIAVRCPALGWRIRVPFLATVKPAEATTVLVRRGEAIELVYRGEGFAVSSIGVAQEDGGKGKAIRVKIPSSVQAVTAIVADVGLASLSR